MLFRRVIIISYLLAGRARALLFHSTPVNYIPGVQLERLGLVKHLDISAHVGVLCVHVFLRDELYY